MATPPRRALSGKHDGNGILTKRKHQQQTVSDHQFLYWKNVVNPTRVGAAGLEPTTSAV